MARKGAAQGWYWLRAEKNLRVCSATKVSTMNEWVLAGCVHALKRAPKRDAVRGWGFAVHAADKV